MNQITLDPKRLVRLFVAFMAVMLLSLSYTQAYAGEPAPPGYFLKAPEEITSDDLKPDAKDVSMKGIEAIIGDHRAESSHLNPIAQAFTVYNAGALIVIAVLFIFTTMLGVLKTAQDGRALGSWSSVMVPFRFVVAMTFLFPTASGYSMAQILLVWIVSNGVGLANMVWSAATDGYLSKAAYSTAGVSSSAKDVSDALNSAILSESCMNLYNEKNGDPKTVTRHTFQIRLADKGVDRVASAYWVWGNQKAVGAFNQAQSKLTDGKHYIQGVNGEENNKNTKGISALECGAVGIRSTQLSGIDGMTYSIKHAYETDGALATLGAIWNSMAGSFSFTRRFVTSSGNDLSSYRSEVNELNRQIFDMKKEALEAALTHIQNVKYANRNSTLTAYDASGLGSTSTPVQVEQMYGNHSYETVLRDAALAYDSFIAAKLQDQNNALQSFLKHAGEKVVENQKNMKEQGWIKAGGYMAALTNSFLDMEGVKAQAHFYKEPTVYDAGASGSALALTKEDAQRINAQLEEAKQNNADLQKVYSDSVTNGEYSIYAETVRKLARYIAYDPQNANHPMVQIQSVGSVLAGTGGAVVAGGAVLQFTYEVASTAISVATWPFRKLANFLGFGGGTKTTGDSSSGGLVSSLAALFANLIWLGWVLMLLGLFLAVIMPLLPVALWLGGIVGWFTAFIVGMVSIPIWNAAHAFPEGSDLAGKGGPGYLLIIELIFRPVLMIFGLLFASVVCAPLMIFMSMLLSMTIDSITSISYNPVVLAGGVVIGIIAYCVGCWIILFRSFHLISVIPQAVFNYIGGQGGQHDEGNTYIAGANLAQRGAISRTSQIGQKAASVLRGEGLGGGRKGPKGSTPSA